MISEFRSKLYTVLDELARVSTVIGGGDPHIIVEYAYQASPLIITIDWDDYHYSNDCDEKYPIYVNNIIIDYCPDEHKQFINKNCDRIITDIISILQEFCESGVDAYVDSVMNTIGEDVLDKLTLQLTKEIDNELQSIIKRKRRDLIDNCKKAITNTVQKAKARIGDQQR